MSEAAAKWFEWKKLRKQLRTKRDEMRAKFKTQGEQRRFAAVKRP